MMLLGGHSATGDRRACALRTAATIGALLGLIGLAGAAPASATEVGVEGMVLRVVDRASDPNVLDVRANGLSYDVYDDYSRLTAGSACISVSVHHVTCPTAMVAEVFVDAGDGGDAVLLREVAVAVKVLGGEGDDFLEGGTSGDRLDGGLGNDAMRGGAGEDTLAGAGGADLLDGGDGSDELSGDEDADILRGDSGNDKLDGGASDDGADLLDGGSGGDKLEGGPGPDVLVSGEGRDFVDPGAGEDRVFATVGDTRTSCTPDDQVRVTGAPTTSAPGALRPDGCARLPADERVPDAWPPPPGDRTATADSSGSARAAGVPKDSAKVVSRASPLRLLVHLYASTRIFRVPVCITTFAKKQRKLQRFPETIAATQDNVPVRIQGERRKVKAAKVVRRKFSGPGRTLSPCRR